MALSMRTSIICLLCLLHQAEQTVFLSGKAANRILHRYKRANFILIEELLRGNLERECYEELCNYEEARETFEDNVKTEQFWKEYYGGKQCSSNPCLNDAECTDTIRSYTCSCAEGYKGTNCQFAINECHLDAEDACQHFCDPKYGPDPYDCSCAAGYKLGKDEKSCHPINPYACGQLLNDISVPVSNLPASHTFPWQVLLLNVEDKQHCSGVIISQSVVLTTAQCIERLRPLFVIVGSDDEPENKQRIQVQSYKIYTKYSSETGDNNVALVRLQDNIKLHKYALPICIPQKDFAENVLMPHVPGSVSGWKRPSNETQELQPIHFSITPTDKGTCELALNVTQTNRMFCGISKSNITSALVDGSHIAIEHKGTWFLVGIAQSSKREANDPNVFLFTKISRFIMWLTHNSR
ncbi:vitamin K-dependent protein Z [Hyperolius riggenbachi]|uniref:vitamin K-dependent protein Z n=1 Tax=Hyperolius riggenbachi TaxID=752182 RepID=UPI0035A2F413